MRNYTLLYGLIFFVFYCSSGEHHHGNEAEHHMHSKTVDELSKVFDDPERETWQKPKEVISLIYKNSKVKNPSDLRVADLGAGSGYFTMRFLDENSKVIALDINEKFLEVIKKKSETHPQKKNLELRKTEPNTVNLKKKEVDVIITVNVYHHIENRIEYLKDLKNGLKDNGTFYLIDFKDGDLPVGPPQKIKLQTKTIEEELIKAGFKVQIDSQLLPYQNIFISSNK
jgi:2-polyprenyl-3-methyl-5-hydroxy-6-metoxy-1,4-benzoquinol methylase